MGAIAEPFLPGGGKKRSDSQGSLDSISSTNSTKTVGQLPMAEEPPAGGRSRQQTPAERKYFALIREAEKISVKAEELERGVIELSHQTHALLEERGDSDSEAVNFVMELEGSAVKLKGMRSRMREIEDDVIRCLQENPALAVQEPPPTLIVGFSEDPHDQHTYQMDPLLGMTPPAHGHWIPLADPPPSQLEEEEEVARSMGGRIIQLQVDSASHPTVDCIIIEPMGKLLDPDSFASSGLVIILHGMPACEEVSKEWTEVMKMTRLLDGGLTVLMPLMLAPDPSVEPDDLRAMTASAMEELGQHSCVVFGKAWGGPWAAEIAALADDPESGLRGKVIALVVFAPSHVQQDVSVKAMQLPTFLTWASDDQESDFEENSPAWIAGLRLSPPPTLWAMVPEGGNYLPSVLEQEASSFFGREVGLALSFFVMACHLRKAVSRHNSSAEEASEVPQEIHRLCEELPDFLSEQFDQDTRMPAALALDQLMQQVGARAALAKLDKVVDAWLKSNLAEPQRTPAKHEASNSVFVPSGYAKE